MRRAKAFYESVFGTQFTKLENPALEPGMVLGAFPTQQTGYGATGALVKMPGFDSGANRVLVYFGCAERAVEAAKAEKAGGRIEKPKMFIWPYGYIALVFDTEGNMIGLHSME